MFKQIVTSTKGIAIGSHSAKHLYYPWLRDNCQCSKCIDPSTRQKLHSSSTFLGFKPKSIDIQQQNVTIIWPDNHTSTFDIRWLELVDSNKTAPKILWNKDIIQKVHLEIDYSEMNTSLKKIGHLLATYGIAILKNVPKDNSSVERIASRFGPIQNTFYGSTWDVKSIPNSKNIAYTSLPLGLHMDLL